MEFETVLGGDARFAKEYDISIHSNPSGKAWAEFFNECLVARGEQPIDPDLMLGWFCNAMMAMHDYVYRKKLPKEMIELQSELSQTKERLMVAVEALNEIDRMGGSLAFAGNVSRDALKKIEDIK